MRREGNCRRAGRIVPQEYPVCVVCWDWNDMREKIRLLRRRLMQPRQHPDVKIRVVWWCGVLGLLLMALCQPFMRDVSKTIWYLVNTMLLLIAAGWAVFHPRSINTALSIALRWAVGLTLFSSLWLYANMDWLIARVGNDYRIPSAAVTFSVFLLAPFLFFGYVMSGLWYASLYAFMARRRPLVETERDIALTVSIAWTLIIALLLVSLVSGSLSLGLNQAKSSHSIALNHIALTGPADGMVSVYREVMYALFWSNALLVLWLIPVSRRVLDSALAGRISRSLSRRLTPRLGLRGRSIALDLRGAALGLLAVLMTLGVDATHILSPVQAVSLASLLRLRGATDNDAGGDPRVNARVVVLTMDGAVRRAALTNRSESAVQADMIRRLKACGASRIVLPCPTLPTMPRTTETRTFEPLPTESDAERSQKDLPLLRQAERDAGNVFAASRYGRGRHSTPDERRVENAASAVFALRLPTYSTPRLPQIPALWQERCPGPVAAYAALQNRAPTRESVPGNVRAVRIAGTTFPCIWDTLLPDFSSTEAVARIPHLTYSEVMGSEPIGLRKAEDWSPGGPPQTTQWQKPEEFFRGKIVYLDSLVPEEVETNIGRVRCTDAQARALVTLLNEELVTRPPSAVPILLLVLLGVIIGPLGLHRNPLDAGWRMALPLLVIVFAYALLAVLGRVWLDPIAPLLMALITFLLVTQTTYALEHDAAGRIRALLQRVMAPETLQVLLENPGSIGLGGTKQQVCVLFADVRNFTRFAESRDPQEVIEVINEYMTALTDAMILHKGIFDKYTGDGMMAFFRIRDAGEERKQVQQAVTAAQAMQVAALDISAQRTRNGKIPLEIGIGLHVGEAVVGMVGSPTLQNYTALGHTVVVSARLQSIAAGGEVVISEAIYARTTGLAAEAGEPVQIKGLSALVTPYRLRMQAGLPSSLLPAVVPAADFDLSHAPLNEV